MRDSEKFIRALITSFGYNRDERYLINTLKMVITSIQGDHTHSNDDSNIIFGTLVLMFGDYGTSPRTGWFPDEFDKHGLIHLIEQRISEIELSIKMNS